MSSHSKRIEAFCAGWSRLDAIEQFIRGFAGSWTLTEWEFLKVAGADNVLLVGRRGSAAQTAVSKGTGVTGGGVAVGNLVPIPWKIYSVVGAAYGDDRIPPAGERGPVKVSGAMRGGPGCGSTARFLRCKELVFLLGREDVDASLWSFWSPRAAPG